MVDCSKCFLYAAILDAKQDACQCHIRFAPFTSDAGGMFADLLQLNLVEMLNKATYGSKFEPLLEPLEILVEEVINLNSVVKHNYDPQMAEASQDQIIERKKTNPIYIYISRSAGKCLRRREERSRTICEERSEFDRTAN